MSGDIYLVTILARDDSTVRLRLRGIDDQSACFPLSPSFAMMLIVDESAPGYAAYRKWYQGRLRDDEDFDPREWVRAVRILEFRALPGEPDLSLTESELPSVRKEALYEIVVDAIDMLAHLTPGTSWGSTAYDEAGQGPFYSGWPEEPGAWERSGSHHKALHRGLS